MRGCIMPGWLAGTHGIGKMLCLVEFGVVSTRLARAISAPRIPPARREPTRAVSSICGHPTGARLSGRVEPCGVLATVFSLLRRLALYTVLLSIPDTMLNTGRNAKSKVQSTTTLDLRMDLK